MTGSLILKMILSGMKNDEIMIVTIDAPKGKRRRGERIEEMLRSVVMSLVSSSFPVNA